MPGEISAQQRKQEQMPCYSDAKTLCFRRSSPQRLGPLSQLLILALSKAINPATNPRGLRLSRIPVVKHGMPTILGHYVEEHCQVESNETKKYVRLPLSRRARRALRAT